MTKQSKTNNRETKFDFVKFLLNQCILFLGATLFVLTTQTFQVENDFSKIILKIAGASFGVAILCFTISLFNLYQIKFYNEENTQNEKQIKIHDKIANTLGETGVIFWRLGIASGLVVSSIILYKI